MRERLTFWFAVVPVVMVTTCAFAVADGLGLVRWPDRSGYA